MIDRERLVLRAKVRELFTLSRQSAGSSSLVWMLAGEGYQAGRYKVRQLMREAELASKQPGQHRYPIPTSERSDIPNLLDRQFQPKRMNQVWCGDITLNRPGFRGGSLT